MLGSGAQMRFPSRFLEFAAYRGEPIAQLSDSKVLALEGNEGSYDFGKVGIIAQT
jgi:hypothetical protein